MLKDIPPVLILGSTALYICYFAPTNLLTTLGWAFAIPFLISGLACLLFITKRYYGYTLAYMAFLAGTLAFNHVVVSLVGDRSINPTDILVIHFVHMSLGVIYLCYLLLVTAVIRWNCESSKEGRAIVQGINLSMGYPLVVTYLLIVPLVLRVRDFYSLCLVSIIPFALSPIGNLILFLVLRDPEIDLLFRQRERQPQFSGRFKLIFFSVLIVGFVSIVLEGYRGMWLLGFLSLGLFVTVSVSLYSILRNLFRERVPEPKPLVALQVLSSQKKWGWVWAATFVVFILYIISYALFC